MEKKFFTELGSYDPGMEIWGGENLEESLKVCPFPKAIPKLYFAIVFDNSCRVLGLVLLGLSLGNRPYNKNVK